VIKVFGAQKIVQIKWMDKSNTYMRFGEVQVEKKKDVAAYLVMVMAPSMLRKEVDPNDKTHWPKDFFQAMMKPEWREWIAAVKKEIESWLVFNAIAEIPFHERKPGSAIVPCHWGSCTGRQGNAMVPSSFVNTLWVIYSNREKTSMRPFPRASRGMASVGVQRLPVQQER
jgi:hypothetical protein